MKKEYQLQNIYILTNSDCVWEQILNGDFDLWKKEIEKNIEKVAFFKEIGNLLKGCMNKENSLVLCDSREEIQKLQELGYFVAGWEHDKIKEGFSGLKLVLQELMEIDIEYLEKIFQRLSEKPWHIADTERLVIREMCEEDLHALYTIYDDEDVIKYTENLYENPEKELQYIKDYRKYIYEFYGYGTWVLIHKGSGELIGRAGLNHRPEFDEPELGFVIAKKYWRQGYAFEACKKILELAKKVYEMDQLQALVKKENLASIKLLEKLQFCYEEDITLDGENFRRYLLDTDIIN